MMKKTFLIWLFIKKIKRKTIKFLITSQNKFHFGFFFFVFFYFFILLKMFLECLLSYSHFFLCHFQCYPNIGKLLLFFHNFISFSSISQEQHSV